PDGSDVDGLTLGAGGSTIRGLAVDRFRGSGIVVTGNNNIIAGNIVGTEAAGDGGLGNGNDGVVIDGCSGNAIGGPGAADRNILSGNGNRGARLQNGASGNAIRNNFIGVDASSRNIVSNLGDGVSISTSPNNTVQGNVIGGNNFTGILVIFDTASGNTI